MKHVLNILLAVGLLMLASLDVADAASKETSKQRAHRKCDNRWSICESKCGMLIDIDNQVRDCQNQCTIKLARCRLKADQAAPAQSQPGDTSSDGPILSPE